MAKKKFTVVSWLLLLTMMFTTMNGVRISASEVTKSLEPRSGQVSLEEKISKNVLTSDQEKKQLFSEEIQKDANLSFESNFKAKSQVIQDKLGNAIVTEAATTVIEIIEVEPNDFTDFANVITDRVDPINEYVVLGEMTDYSSDRDVFTFTLPKSGEIESFGLWMEEFYMWGWEDDLYIALYDAEGSFIAAHDYIVLDDVTGEACVYLNTWLPAGTYFFGVTANEAYGDLYVYEDYGFDLLYTQDIYYNVTFNTSGGSTVPSTSVPEGQFLQLPANPSKTGYTFGGWYKNYNCTIPWTFSLDTVNSNVTLYAKWVPNVYSVTFETNGGSFIPQVQVAYGNKIVQPAAPTKAGYTFGGWFRYSTLVQPWDFNMGTVNGNMQLYAKWISTDIVSNVFGMSRYSTAVAISKASYASASTAILVLGTNFPDALSAGPLAIQENAPILLTKTAMLPQETTDELIRLGVKKVIILGGVSVVGPEVVAALTNLGIATERISGNSRYETAVAVARQVRAKSGVTNKIILTNGWEFADALSIGSYASKEGIPILLTKADVLQAATKSALIEFGVEEVIVIGGNLAVSEAIIAELQGMGITITRSFGSTRFETVVAVAEKYFPTANKAIVSYGFNFADALSAAPYAAMLNAPIVLVRQNLIPTAISDYISRSTLTSVIVIGGNDAVGVEVKSALEGLLIGK